MARDQAFVVTARQPGACRALDFAAFETLVIEGGERNPIGLSKRIARAEILAFAERPGMLIGIGALRHPENSYQARVFANAGRPLLAPDFVFELCWVYVIPAYRNRGVGRKIVGAVLNAAGDRRVFATSGSDNGPMHGCLERSGFMRKGKPIPGRAGTHAQMLFVH